MRIKCIAMMKGVVVISLLICISPLFAASTPKPGEVIDPTRFGISKPGEVIVTSYITCAPDATYFSDLGVLFHDGVPSYNGGVIVPPQFAFRPCNPVNKITRMVLYYFNEIMINGTANNLQGFNTWAAKVTEKRTFKGQKLLPLIPKMRQFLADREQYFKEQAKEWGRRS